MMIVDMETQDAEDPWLSDDDLKLETSGSGGVHHAVVRADDESPRAVASSWWDTPLSSTKS